MTSAKLTSKGQVTVPKSIREALGIETGDRIEFVLRANGVVELLPRRGRLVDLAGMLGPAPHRSVEQMDAAIGQACHAADRIAPYGPTEGDDE